MIIRNLSQLNEYLDSELSWRKKELTTLKFRLQQCRDHELGILTRAALCLLYAHWEGFVKVAATGYVEYIVRQGVRLRDLTPNFIALAVRAQIGAAGRAEKSTIHTELVAKLTSDLSDRFRPDPDSAIETNGNLKISVLTEILSVTGIESTRYLGKKAIIDDLVNQRNLVAHGAHGEGFDISLDDYIALHSNVITLVDMFRTDVENAANVTQYLRSTGSQN